jgi:hypothetical protein
LVKFTYAVCHLRIKNFPSLPQAQADFPASGSSFGKEYIFFIQRGGEKKETLPFKFMIEEF